RHLRPRPTRRPARGQHRHRPCGLRRLVLLLLAHGAAAVLLGHVTGPVPPQEARRLELRGLHHITLICSSLDRSVAFYRDVLGLRLVKQTVNHDDRSARHFYFGDALGTPGTVITCMEYPQMEEGVVGRGSTHHSAFVLERVADLDGWR